jgi:hypothetical protein
VDLANGGVNSAKVADNSLTGPDVANESRRDDIRQSTLQGVTEKCPRADERLLGDMSPSRGGTKAGRRGL